MNRNKAVRKLFSLIEMLIVVAILLILFSMTLPAFRRALQSARIAACMSNLHQIGMAMDTYTEIYAEYPIGLVRETSTGPVNDIPFIDHGKMYWVHRLAPLIDPDLDESRKNPDYPLPIASWRSMLSMGEWVFHCPADARPVNLSTYSSSKGWEYWASYCANENICPSDQRHVGGTPFKALRVTQVQEPARTIFSGDGLSASTVVESSGKGWASGGNGYFLLLRHGDVGELNLLFCDGHAELHYYPTLNEGVPIPELDELLVP